jgi:hypothetical protein
MSSKEDAELQRAIRLSAAEYRRQQPASPSPSSPSSPQLRAAGQSVVVGAEAGGAGGAGGGLRVGDPVRVRRGLSRPLHGWGPVQRHDVGTITAVFPGSPTTCAVSFGAKTEPLGAYGWMCALADLARAAVGEPSSSSGSSSSSSSSYSSSSSFPNVPSLFSGMAVDTSGDRALAAMLSEQQKIEHAIQQQHQQHQQHH